MRDAELGRLLRFLSYRKPAVVVLTGDPGMGKSLLLGALRERAIAQGWEVAGGLGDADALEVGPLTSEPRFRDAVLAALGRRAPAPNPALGLPSPRRPSGADPFVADLARRAPVLVMLDDYRPSPPFARWFERRLALGLRSVDAAIVFVVATQTVGPDLAGCADAVIELKPLSLEAVRGALLAIDPPLRVPLDAHELDAYSRHARSPGVLGSLIRVLTLEERLERTP